MDTWDQIKMWGRIQEKITRRKYRNVLKQNYTASYEVLYVYYFWTIAYYFIWGTISLQDTLNSWHSLQIHINYFKYFQIKALRKCICAKCFITSMVWTKYDNLITGCSNGILCLWTQHLQLITELKLHIGEIINIKLSGSEDNFVTSGIDKTVKFLNWHVDKPFHELKYTESVKVFAFDLFPQHIFLCRLP